MKPMLECTGCGSRETVAEIRAKFPKALSCCPERDMQPVAVYMIEVDAGTDNACWVVANRVDPGAVRFEAQQPLRGGI